MENKEGQMAKREAMTHDRLIVPSNNFNLWRINAPDMKLARLTASVEYKSIKTTTMPFEFGGVKLGTIEANAINRLRLSYTAEGFNQALTLTDIARALVQIGVTEVFLSSIAYYKEIKDMENDDLNDLYKVSFECFTPHRNQDRKRITNSTTYPDEQLYILQEDIRSKFGKNRNDKSSVMILGSIAPHADQIDDLSFISKVEYPFMFHYYMKPRDWQLASSQFKKHNI